LAWKTLIEARSLKVQLLRFLDVEGINAHQFFEFVTQCRRNVGVRALSACTGDEERKTLYKLHASQMRFLYSVLGLAEKGVAYGFRDSDASEFDPRIDRRVVERYFQSLSSGCAIRIKLFDTTPVDGLYSLRPSGAAIRLLDMGNVRVLRHESPDNFWVGAEPSQEECSRATVVEMPLPTDKLGDIVIVDGSEAEVFYIPFFADSLEALRASLFRYDGVGGSVEAATAHALKERRARQREHIVKTITPVTPVDIKYKSPF
jgi:hypothetical protein